MPVAGAPAARPGVGCEAATPGPAAEAAADVAGVVLCACAPSLCGV